MARIKLPLEMKSGIKVRTLEELKENWDLEDVLTYFQNGRLITWLKDRYYNEIAEQVGALENVTDTIELQKQICNIFDMQYEENKEIDIEEIESRNKKLNELRKVTADDSVLKNADKVAFNQEDLADLLDKGEKEIYLINGRFSIPLQVENINYIGVGDVVAVINSKIPVDFSEKGITFNNIVFDEKYTLIENTEGDTDENSPTDIQETTNRRKRKIDIYYDLNLTLEEAAFGVNKDIPLIRFEECDSCNGTGITKRNKTCPDCQRTGVIEKHGNLKIKIPAGIRSGTQLCLKNEGHTNARKTSIYAFTTQSKLNKGNLYVNVTVKPHDFFERDDDDLYCEISIDMAEAALGTEVEVPTLTGSVIMKIPAGTQPGKVLRLRGKGIKHYSEDGYGDQLVRIKVIIPTDLTDRQKYFLERYWENK